MAAGKTFFKKKKQPIPVDLTGKDWAGQVRKATEATYMHHTGGTCINIRWAAALYPLKACQAIFNVLIIVGLSREEEIESEGIVVWLPGWRGARSQQSSAQRTFWKQSRGRFRTSPRSGTMCRCSLPSKFLLRMLHACLLTF